MGGMHFEQLDDLAVKIWNWCIKRDITISAQYFPGCENVYADALSRQFADSTEWKLKHDIFVRICKHFFEPDIDLFASRINTQLKKFVSWNFDPDAYHVDAFTFSWSNLSPYIFPPFKLIGRIINKLFEDRVKQAIIIAPLWKTQTWFPQLMSALISFPVRLPRHKDLLVMPHTGELHPLHKMTLIACIVSGDHSKIKGWQDSIVTLSLPRYDLQLPNSTSAAGRNMHFGVLNGMSIPILPLKLM